MRALRILLMLFAAGLVLALPGDRGQAAPQATLTVTMSNPACVQSPANSGTCYVIIRGITATASDQSFTNLDISIDGQVRARVQTFFESTAYVYHNMFGRGLLVSCGRPNEGGNPAFGHRYQVAFNGYLASSGVPAASGTALVYCPYYEGKVYLPIVRK
jgi:hypothetical protein